MFETYKGQINFVDNGVAYCSVFDKDGVEYYVSNSMDDFKSLDIGLNDYFTVKITKGEPGCLIEKQLPVKLSDEELAKIRLEIEEALGDGF